VAGHLDDKILIAAVGMGNLIQNVIFSGPMNGANAGVETLVPQAKGAGDLRLAAVYLNKGRVVLSGFFIIIYSLCFYIGSLLEGLGQNKAVCDATQVYILYFAPALFLYFLADLQRKFLNSLGKSVLPMISQLIMAFCFPFLCYYLAIYLDWKLVGIAVTSIALNGFTFLFNVFLTWYDPDTSETCIWPDRTSFRDFDSYLAIGLPNMISQAFDMLSYEVLTLSSGLIGVTE